MSEAPNSLVKLILDSKALSIWNRKTGPVFWYAAGVPGPFYLNTELMIGRELSEQLLDKITAIVAEIPDLAARAAQLNTLMMDAYRQNADYKTVIKAMIETTQAAFPTGTYTAISGGERRDWLFSIPLATELGIKHIYLFKNQSLFCTEPLQAGEKTLHVSDLINNAASYFDVWLPALQKAGLKFAGTITVNTRGLAGVKRMEEAGHKLVALNRVELPFFQQSCDSGLIDKDTLDEIAVYFTSPQEWAGRYLMDRDPALFDIAHLDKKSFERMKSFFTQDPWDLREKHAAFFDKMLNALHTSP